MISMINTVFNLIYSPESTLLILTYFLSRYAYGWFQTAPYSSYLTRRNSGKNDVEAPEETNIVLTALEIPGILTNILHHLTVPDILECSLVNQLWRKQSRKFLREKKHCVIVLKSDFCLQIEELHNMLKNSTDLPFIGLYFQVDQHTRVLNPSWGEQNDLRTQYPLLFQRLPVQYLIINYPTLLDCVCDEFLEDLLVLRAAECTEYLEIINWPTDLSFSKYLKAAQTSLELIENFRFQNLKIFKADYGESEDIFKWKLIRYVVNVAPSLTSLHGPILGRMLKEGSSFVGPLYYPQLPQGKRHLIKNLIVETHWELDKLAKMDLKLEVLSLPQTLLGQSGSTIIDSNKSRVTQVFRIIESSQDSLVQVLLHRHLLPLITNRCPLVNLRKLFVRFHPSYPGFLELCTLLQATDFQTFLPKLAEITITIKESTFPRNYSTADLLKTSSKFQCYSVKTMRISTIDNPSAEFYKFHRLEFWNVLAEIFPNVKSLSVPDLACDGVLWDHIGFPWKHSLESLTCMHNDFPVNNLGCFWEMLIKLLEKLSLDISLEELNSIDRFKFRDYAYAATRRTFFKEFGLLKSLIFEMHHQKCEVFYNKENFERFEIISSWMEAKFPDVKIHLKHKTCSGTFCNPLFLPVGIPTPTNSLEFARRHELRLVCLKDWSEIVLTDRGRLAKFGDIYRELFIRIFQMPWLKPFNWFSSWRNRSVGCGFLFLFHRLFHWLSEPCAEVFGLFCWLLYTFNFVFINFCSLQWNERHSTYCQNVGVSITGLFLPTIFSFILSPFQRITDHCAWYLLYLLSKMEKEELLSSEQVLNCTRKYYSFHDLLHDLNYS